MTYYSSRIGSGIVLVNDVDITNDLTVGDDATVGDKLTLSNATDDDGELIIFGGNANATCFDLTNAGTGDAIYVNQTGVLAGGGYGFQLYSNVAQTNNSLMFIWNDNASTIKATAELRNDGTGASLVLNQDGDGIALNIDSEATSADSINIDAINTSGIVVDINLNPASSSTATALDVRNNTNCTEPLVNFENSGSGHGFRLRQVVELGGGRNLFSAFSSAIETTNNLVTFEMQSSGSNQNVFWIGNNGSGSAQFIDMNGATGNALEIDQDSNSASDQYAFKIASDNAGAGLGCGIDMSSFSVDEPLIKAPNDAVTTAGTLTKQIAVDVAGTTYYLMAYTTGS